MKTLFELLQNLLSSRNALLLLKPFFRLIEASDNMLNLVLPMLCSLNQLLSLLNCFIQLLLMLNAFASTDLTAFQSVEDQSETFCRMIQLRCNFSLSEEQNQCGYGQFEFVQVMLFVRWKFYPLKRFESSFELF